MSFCPTNLLQGRREIARPLLQSRRLRSRDPGGKLPRIDKAASVGLARLHQGFDCRTLSATAAVGEKKGRAIK
jgi:hypothetical protein